MTTTSTRGTAPAMPIYASDLMVKIEYRLMSFTERGLLFSMLCECWANGEIPSSPDELSVFLGKEVDNELIKRVAGFFQSTDRKTIFSPDLETYRAKIIDGRERMSEGGKKGAESKKQRKHLGKDAEKPPSNHPINDRNKVVNKPLDNLTSSSLQGLEYEFESEYEYENHPNQGDKLTNNKEIV